MGFLSLPYKKSKPRIAFLISGRGSNMATILKQIKEKKLKAHAAFVFSDRADAAGLEKARKAGIPAESFSVKQFNSKIEYEKKLVERLKAHQVDWVVCAGYMRILGSTVLEAYPYRITNIHPSLLPAFPGLRAQQQALDYGVKHSGCTIHFVDAGMDTGPIIAQKVVEVKPGDTEETLARRIMKAEHETYWRALKSVFRGFEIDKRKVILKKDYSA